MHQLLHIVWNPEIEAFSIFGITIRYYFHPVCHRVDSGLLGHLQTV